MARRKSQRKHVGKPGHSSGKRVRRVRKPDWPVLGLALFGMLLTAWLTALASTTGGAPLCAEGSGCDLIQASRWSTLFGIPVALFGFFTYGLIAFVSFEMKPSLKRWRWQWAVALLGMSISLYLTLIGLIQIQAVCIWCLVSLATITAIFLWLTIQRPESAPGGRWRDWLLNTASLTAAVIIVMQLHYSGFLGPGMGRENPQLRDLAIHLDERDAKFYGASWCPACQEQLDMFRASSDRLPYVECSPQGRGGLVASACITADIRSYPTWIINGERHEGVLEPEELARLSRFQWDDNGD